MHCIRLFSSSHFIQLDVGPKHGRTGVPVEVVTNYIALRRSKVGDFFQHSVQFSPELDDIRLMRFLVYQVKDQLGIKKMLCDGRILYTFDSLGNEEQAKRAIATARSGMEYEVEISFTNRLSSLDRQGLPVRK